MLHQAIIEYEIYCSWTNTDVIQPNSTLTNTDIIQLDP